MNRFKKEIPHGVAIAIVIGLILLSAIVILLYEISLDIKEWTRDRQSGSALELLRKDAASTTYTTTE